MLYNDIDIIAFAKYLEKKLDVDLTCISETGDVILNPLGSIVVLMTLISILKIIGRASAKKAE